MPKPIFVTILCILLKINASEASYYETCPHDLLELDEKESMRFVYHYFSQHDCVFNGHNQLRVVDHNGEHYHPLKHLADSLYFYGLDTFSILSFKHATFYDVHRFLYHSSWHLSRTLLNRDDDPMEINTDEYWTALVLCRFLKPPRFFSPEPIAFLKPVLDWLWAHSPNKASMSRLFTKNTPFYAMPEHGTEGASFDCMTTIKDDCADKKSTDHVFDDDDTLEYLNAYLRSIQQEYSKDDDV